MKNIQNYLLLIAVIFFSCEDILTEEPVIFLSETNFYKTEKDAVSATNATYSELFSSYVQYYYPTVATDI